VMFKKRDIVGMFVSIERKKGDKKSEVKNI
jgi:hypothetical protein